MVDILIKKGADVNATNKEGATALHKATEVHNLEVMASLLRQGAKVSGRIVYISLPRSLVQKLINLRLDIVITLS